MPDETHRTPEEAAARETIPLAEERVRIDTRETERQVATISLRTRAEDVPVHETLRRERVDIERRPADRVTDEVPRTREEDGVTIIPIVEEVLVRRFRVVEELHIRRRAEDVTVEETVTLRRQEARIDPVDPAAPDPGAAPAARPGEEDPA